MTTIADGCSIAQVAKCYEKHKITYYVVDFNYKFFGTNNHIGYHRNLPRLIFVCANNHMCPIDDNEKRGTIFKSCSIVGVE
jgi:hypothetical protein